MECNLSPEERNLLKEVLQEHQRVLLHEISRADGRGYRLMLREKEAVLESLLRKVHALEHAAA